MLQDIDGTWQAFSRRAFLSLKLSSAQASKGSPGRVVCRRTGITYRANIFGLVWPVSRQSVGRIALPAFTWPLCFMRWFWNESTGRSRGVGRASSLFNSSNYLYRDGAPNVDVGRHDRRCGATVSGPERDGLSRSSGSFALARNARDFGPSLTMP